MGARADSVPRSVDCLLVSPADPLTRRMRAGPLQRFRHPPPGFRYVPATDRIPIPASSGEYRFTAANVGLTTLKFAVEHLVPLDQRRCSLVHSFFWDVRKFVRPWVHESDQSFGQFLSGYNNVGGFVKRRVTEGYSSYLNSRGCIGVVTWSRWAKIGYVEDGVDGSKVFVIPPPFPRVNDRKPHDGCNVLFTGRDFARKGGDIALKAFSGVAAPGCRLFFIGRVEDQRFRKIIRDDPRIVHLERPSAETLWREVWPLIDVFALPTRADAFAVTVIDAMRRGIPVISTRLPAIAEVVEDGRSGLLPAAGDGGGFADCLRRLVEDPELRLKMGAEAGHRAEALFAPDAINRRLSKVYSLGRLDLEERERTRSALSAEMRN